MTLYLLGDDFLGIKLKIWNNRNTEELFPACQDHNISIDTQKFF